MCTFTCIAKNYLFEHKNYMNLRIGIYILNVYCGCLYKFKAVYIVAYICKSYASIALSKYVHVYIWMLLIIHTVVHINILV